MSPTTDSAKVDTIDGVLDEKTITFTKGGTNEDTFFSVEKGVTISEAQFFITGEAVGTDYPSNISLDIGGDKHKEWRYEGPGMGSLGKQYMMDTNSAEKTLSFSIGGGIDTSTTLRFPAGAQVKSATMVLTGYEQKGSTFLVAYDPTANFSAIENVTQALTEIGCIVTAADDVSLPSGWSTSGVYDSVLWFGGNTRWGSAPADALCGQFATFVQGGGNAFLSGTCVDATSQYWGANEMPFFTWAVHHTYGSLWNGWPYSSTTSPIYTTPQQPLHEVFSNPNTLPSTWHNNYPEEFGTSPLGVYNGGQVISKAGLSPSASTYNDIVIWDGPAEDLGYGRTMLVRHPIDYGWLSSDQGNVLNPFIQNLASWFRFSPPSNITLDVGADGGEPEHHIAGELVSSDQVPDFSVGLNLLIENADIAGTTSYGIPYVDIPVSVSSTSAGYVKLSGVDIRYDVALPIGGQTIIAALNDFIPDHGEGNISIPLAIYSKTAGKIRISDVMFAYDGKPVASHIPNFEVDEDTVDETICDLSDYFFDDFDPSESLVYKIDHTSQDDLLALQDKIGIEVVDGHYLQVNATEAPDWNSEEHDSIKVAIEARDSNWLTTVSNEFSIFVKAKNDEPRVNLTLGKIELQEDSIDSSIHLDSKSYFRDVEGNIMFYEVELDPLDVVPDEELSVTLDPLSNTVEIVPHENYNGKNIPLWIYCDDDDEVNTKEHGVGNYIHQEVLIDVTPVNDEPIWVVQLEDITIMEDSPAHHIIHLKEHVYDPETPIDDLNFILLKNSKDKYVDIEIDNETYVNIDLKEDYFGGTEVEVQVIDESGRNNKQSFLVTVEPVNDLPIVDLSAPSVGDDLSGTVILTGTTSDVEVDDGTQLGGWVEVKIGDEEWQHAHHWRRWDLAWDTTAYENGDWDVSVRAYDGKDYGQQLDFTFSVHNHINIPPKVSVISPLFNETVWGKVTIRGSASDVDGIVHAVYISVGGTDNWTIVDGTKVWSYVFDTKNIVDGSLTLYFRSFDGIEYSHVVGHVLVMYNQEHVREIEDNPNLVEPDKESLGPASWLVSLMILLIVLLVLTALVVYQRRKKELIAEIEPDLIEAEIIVAPVKKGIFESFPSFGEEARITPALATPVVATLPPSSTVLKQLALPPAKDRDL